MSGLRILYIAYWGAAEPLGQSLILPAVEVLSLSADITLVTFEKPADLADGEEIARIRERLERAGIEWLPLRYHKRPKLPATAFDILHGIAVGIRLGRRKRAAIVHGRTFIGALIGSIVAMVLRTRFVHHNEGFYPDEQVDGGVWRYGSLTHRIARFLERWMYGRADAVICMSRRSRAVLEKLPAVQHHRTPLLVVPSCVDLDHFKANDTTKRSDRVRLVYIGSVGHRYIVDKLARFVRVAASVFGNLELRVLTRADRNLVASMIRAGGLNDEAWSLDTAPHSAIPGELASSHAGLFFLQQGISQIACSPTKIGEYWASGIPVVTTAGVSDTDEIIHDHRVGVIIGEHTDHAYLKAARELQTLLHDPQLAARCRKAAEDYYALTPFCAQQVALYARLVSASPHSQRP